MIHCIYLYLTTNTSKETMKKVLRNLNYLKLNLFKTKIKNHKRLEKIQF